MVTVIFDFVILRLKIIIGTWNFPFKYNHKKLVIPQQKLFVSYITICIQISKQKRLLTSY